LGVGFIGLVEKAGLSVFDLKTKSFGHVNSSMKKLMITAALMVTMVVAKAQNYWVVETDKTNVSVVKIYDSKDQLISESKLARRIDITKRKHRKRLDQMVRSRENSGLPVWSKR